MNNLRYQSKSTNLMLDEVIFYTLEKTIKRYRQFAQSNLDRAGVDITIDQWLILNVIQEEPTLGQHDIADRVFKDQASVARIINLLVKKGLLIQNSSLHDRRRVDRVLTPLGVELLQTITPLIIRNRAVALRGLTDADIAQLRHLLNRVFANSQPDNVAP